MGLLAFADDAFTVAPLTDDAANVALFLDALSPDVMPIDGHRPDRAIAARSSCMRQAGFDRGDILLLTDHGDAAANAAAAQAAKQGMRVSVLGLGSEAGHRRAASGRWHLARVARCVVLAIARERRRRPLREPVASMMPTCARWAC